MSKMSKISKAWPISSVKKHKFHWIHIFAVLILGGYFLLSKVNIVHALTQENIIISFLQLYLFGTGFGLFLLYILSHEKFFPVALEIEKEEERQEKSFFKKYLRHGKILATFLIGTVGGPVFSALTARMLLKNFTYKYLIVVLANIPSTLFTLGLGRGILSFI